MSQLQTKKVRRRKSKSFYRIKEILMEQGKDAEWFGFEIDSLVNIILDTKGDKNKI